MFFVFRDHHPGGFRSRKGRLQTVEGPELDQLPVLLHEPHLVTDFFLLVLCQRQRVQFIAKGAEDRDRKPHMQGRQPVQLVVRNGRHMGAHGRDRIEHARAILDLQTFHRIGVVAGPGLGSVIQHTGIEPRPAGSAGFKEDLRMGFGEAVIQGVDPENEPVIDRPLLIRRIMQGVDLRERPVHVPLDVGNAGFVQDLLHGIANIRHDLWIGEVQHELFPAGGNPASRCVHEPVRVAAVEIRIHGNHLRLEPEPELDAHILHLSAEAAQAGRQFPAVRDPVPQGCGISVAALEPPVVQHEHLQAQVCGGLCHLQDPGFIHIHVDAFPGIQEQRPGFIPEASPGQAFAEQAVEGLGHGIQSLLCIDQHCLRCLEGLTRLQGPGEGIGVDPHGHPGGVIGVHICLRQEVAGIHQGQAEAFTTLFGGFPALQAQERIVVVGRMAPEGVNGLHSGVQGMHFNVPLPGPGTCQHHLFPVVVRQVQGQGHHPVQDIALAAQVLDPGIAADHRPVFIDGIGQHQPRLDLFIPQP